MELQAIRYAAMVANMTFEKAVRAFDHYSTKNGLEITDNADDELLVFDNKTYAFSNQHGKGAFEMIEAIFQAFPRLEGEIGRNGR